MLGMFRIGPTDHLYDTIIRMVSREPEISVADLHRALKKSKTSVTLQHLYRKINTLVSEEIMIKRNSKLTLNLVWLSYMEFFATESRERLISDRTKAVFPLKKGQRISFSASTIGDVQTLWNHLLIQLHRASPQKQLYKYYSHSWWVWNKRTLDVNFYRKIYENGVRCLWLYGGNTLLDREAAQMYPDILDSCIAPDAPFPKEGYNLNVYGDYVFECIFPENIAKHLELVFRSIDSVTKEDKEFLDDIFTMRGDFTVTVWHNPQLASKLRTKIGRYFLFGAKRIPDVKN